MIDLHTHSTFSDGSLTPEQLVTLAKEGGIRRLALTDHDTAGGQPRFLEAAQRASIETITGIELSAANGESEVHMLGYGYDPNSALLNDALTRVKAAREDRNRKILARLHEVGVELSWSDIEAEAGEEVIGRPHFATALIKRGIVENKFEAFERYLGQEQLAYIPRVRLSLNECIDTIHEAGGVAVLAHPLYLSRDRNEFLKLLEECKSFGMDGLEVYYNAYSPDDMQQLQSYADGFDLITTGGTDFHGAFTPGVELGRGRTGNLNVPESVWLQLNERIASNQHEQKVQS